MPKDEFKTQVLLLHSEQSTLDNLRSGFSDNYTVHCATSGSEALNTLVETPINVIVTAQELPGMSGLEALREAKKRSPDTVGILLAGGADSSLEALVGDKEVFEIVRGNVTNDTVLKLVEKATQQIRLMALAESANDTAANPDEPAPQHIVMETSENGSPIVSDGTGRMPALDPKKVSASVSVGSQAVDVLVLTKDEEFLETIRDSSRGMHKVFNTNTLAQADEAIRKYKIGVAVVDSAMVGEKIEQLTQHLRKNSPRLVSIVAGRRDDGEMLMDLINRGKVYRFLLKPVSPGRARLAVEASVKHHLEAPDTAFGPMSGVATPASAPKAKQKAKPKPVTNASPPLVAKAMPAPIEKIEASSESSAPVPGVKTDPPVAPIFKVTPSPTEPESAGVNSADAGNSEETARIEARLSDAFGDEDNRFVETVTGLLGLTGRKSLDDTGSISIEDTIVADTNPDSPFDSTSGGSFLQNPKLLGLGAAVIAVIAVGVFWFMSNSGNPSIRAAGDPDSAAVAGTDSNSETGPAPQSNIESNPVLADARSARATGQIFNPVNENAIDLFAAALAAAPDDSTIAVEFNAVIEEALGMAETALLDNRLGDASDALQRVSANASDHARLPFLTAQLAQLQLRSHLDEARAAIRENRFEDAVTTIAAARSLDLPDAADIDIVETELSSALSAQKVDAVLAKANDRLESGLLLSPPNDNARYYYGLALSVAAGNTEAQQGLNIIASKLVLQARNQIDNGNFRLAENLLSDARATDASNIEITATTTVLSDARAVLAEQKRLAAAAALKAQQDLEAAAEAEAEALRIEQEKEAERVRLAALIPSAANPQQIGDTPQIDDAATKFAAALPTAAVKTDTATAMNSKSTAVKAQTLVPVSSLTRKRYVAPRYPRAAQRRGIAGWVDVRFTVSLDGTTKNVAALNSEPGETFVNSAIKAVEKWEFEPIMDNGAVVEKQAGIRMMFAIEN